jgi:hypothetical protein
MKLWLCTATCTDYDPVELHVAETEEQAKKMIADSLDEQMIWYASVSADVVEVVDGFGIDVI